MPKVPCTVTRAAFFTHLSKQKFQVFVRLGQNLSNRCPSSMRKNCTVCQGKATAFSELQKVFKKFSTCFNGLSKHVVLHYL